MLREIEGLAEAKECPYIVQLHAGYVEADSVTLALEFMDGGCLTNLQKRMHGNGVPSRMLACIARQTVCGLHYLHWKKNMLHRDIKPENILYNGEGKVKLTDFGISKILDIKGGATLTPVGTQ